MVARGPCRRCGSGRSSGRRCGRWCSSQARPPPWSLCGPWVALRWWRDQMIVKERARVALLALSRCGGRGGSRTRGAIVARSNGHGRGPCGPWWLFFASCVVFLEGHKSRGGGLGQLLKCIGVHGRALAGYIAPVLAVLVF